jgi:hypothetical protein
VTLDGAQPVSADWYGRLPDCVTWALAQRPTVVKVIDPPPDVAYRLVGDLGLTQGITSDVRTFRRTNVLMTHRRPATAHDRFLFRTGLDRNRREWHLDRTGVLVSICYEPDYDRVTEVVYIPLWTADP